MKSLGVLSAVLLLLPTVACAQEMHKSDAVQKSNSQRVLRPAENSSASLEGLRQIAHFAEFLGQLLSGGTEAITAPDTMPVDPSTQLSLGKFLSRPGLWIGLAVTAAFLTAAVRLRYRGPIR